MTLRSSSLARVAILSVLLLPAAASLTENARGDTPPLTAQQKERLKERDDLDKQTQKLRAAGKLAEAIQTAEKMLAIEREILGNFHADVAGSLHQLAELHEQLEHFAKGRKALEEELAIKTKLRGADNWQVTDVRVKLKHLDTVSRLSPEQRAELREADRISVRVEEFFVKKRKTVYARVDMRQALPLALKVKDFRERVLGKLDIEYADSLNSLVVINYEIGGPKELSEAEELCRKLMGIYIQIVGEKHPRFAGSLRNLANLRASRGGWCWAAHDLTSRIRGLYKQGKLAEAIPLANQRKEVWEAFLDKTGPDYGECLNDLAILYYASGDQARADPLFRQAKEVFQKGNRGPRHPDSLNNLANEYLRVASLAANIYTRTALPCLCRANLAPYFTPEEIMGPFYTEAKLHFSRAAEIYEHTIGRNSVDYADNMTDLATIHLWGPGSYYLPREAERCLRQAVDSYRKCGEIKSSQYVTCLFQLGDACRTRGDYATAEQLYREATNVTKEKQGNKSLQYGVCLYRLGGLHESTGAFGKAEAYYHQTLPIFEAERHISWQALTLNGLARLYLLRGARMDAEATYRRAIETLAPGGFTAPEYPQCLEELGRLYLLGSDYAKAEPLFREASEIRKKLWGDTHPRFGDVSASLAALYTSKGEYSTAELYHRQCLEIFKHTLGEGHSSYTSGLLNFALHHAVTNHAATGEPLAFKAAQTIRKRLARTAAWQTEAQQLATAEREGPALDSFLTVCTEAGTPAERVHDQLLLWKGAVTSRQAAVRRFRANLERAGNKELLAVYDDLLASTRQLANLLGKTPDQRELPNYRRKVQQLTDRVESLEKKLAAASAEYRREQEERQRTSADLARALPANAAFIDLMEYNHFLPVNKRKDPKQRWERRLAAFIVRPNRAVVRVNVGPAGPIGEAIGKWRKNFDSATGSEIRRLVWEPLAPHLAGATAVLISPDGALTRFPFAALPGKRPNSYLIEDLAVAVIAVPQQLPELLATEKKPADPSMLVVGAVNYGGNPGTAVAGLSRDAAQRLDGSRLTWKTLPATGPEAHIIREQFQSFYPGGTISELTGDAATEDAIRRLAGKRRYLHFATHGYYDPPGLRSMLADASRPEGLSIGSQTITGWHPGLLCGLVLAGANRPMADGRDDGILTAMELGAFDLAGVELAVLSACQTAQGEYVAGGEGLLGLQRAFQTAGARSVVASLWSVNDAATQKLMTRFYENLWQKKLPKLEALRQAQLSMLYSQADASARRDLATVPDEPADPRTARRSPRLWAAWVLSGDPGDLSQVYPVSERTSAYPPVAADSPGWRWPISPWLLAGAAAVLAFCWVAWRRLRRRGWLV